MEGLIIIIVSLALMGLFIWWVIRYTKKTNALKTKFFGDLALKHGFNHTTSKYMLTVLNTVNGTWNGMAFSVFEKMEGSGKNRSIVTRAAIENVPFDYNFRIGKEHLFSKAGKLFGLKDIEFGDAEFDRKFLIKSDNEEKFRAFFNYKLQGQLKELKNDLTASVRVQDGQMTYISYGPLLKDKAFESFEKVLGFMFSLLVEAKGRHS